jgi:serine/threonine protein kinase/tetratricopeptide (TPR) repeat protein
LIGTTLGHYRITAKLGHGGMGEVYRAEDSRLKRDVALKVLPGDLAGSQERLARFQREAEVVAGLNHPNIVTLHSVEEDQGVHFLTMELVDGKSLDELMQSAGMTLERIFELAIPIADALSSAHEKGIVHRDLKPANIMVNVEGRVKVLDFGLAKLAEQSDAPEGSGEEATQALTQEGKVLGTVPYMSPEQVQGREVDARSDIFSFGVILYELATGARPFAGDTSADLISAILRDKPSSVTELKGDLPHHLGRIVGHCLEKDLKRRYQTALDVRNELEILRREIDAGIVHTQSESSAVAPTSAARPKWLVPAAAVGGALVLGTLGWSLLSSGGDSAAPEAASVAPESSTVASTPDQKSLAVLYFDNLSGDEDLDWLRSGLAEMLVTDLSQSPDLRVLPTNRLNEILSGMKQLDQRIESFEVIREVAEKADASTVVTGSFAKMGETIRISIKIQDAASGEILVAHNVDALAQEELFSRVDDLSRNIRQSIELPEAPQGGADRNLAEVTTSSVEAYRLFIEADALHYEAKEEEASELFRAATEADPEFAMAWAKLAMTLGNSGRGQESDEAREQAMAHLDRLTEPERGYVEQAYYRSKLATHARAIETAEATLATYPHLIPIRHNLALSYSGHWMYEKALEHLEEAFRQGHRFYAGYTMRATLAMKLGDPVKAERILRDKIREEPEGHRYHYALSNVLFDVGRMEEAREALDSAIAIRPVFFAPFNQFQQAVVRQDWEGAAEAIEAVRQIGLPWVAESALGLEETLALYHGRSAEALAYLEESLATPQEGPPDGGRDLGASFSMVQYEQFDRALEFARQAQRNSAGDWPEYVGPVPEILALENLGQSRRADLRLEEFEQSLKELPGVYKQWMLATATGELALIRSQWDAAIIELKKAATLANIYDPEGPSTRFSLGRALFEAGRLDQAAQRFEQVIGATRSRVYDPIAFVRSYDYLGRIHQSQGNREKAHEYFQTFLNYWGDGDMDRDRIEAARAFVSGS